MRTVKISWPGKGLNWPMSGRCDRPVKIGLHPILNAVETVCETV